MAIFRERALLSFRWLDKRLLYKVLWVILSKCHSLLSSLNNHLSLIRSSTFMTSYVGEVLKNLYEISQENNLVLYYSQFFQDYTLFCA